MMLNLCGSYVSFMERETLSYQSPLYGRRAGQMQLQPLNYREASDFFPHYSPADRILAYAILGGMPFYLPAFDPARSIRHNILTKLLDPTSVLYSEARLLPMEELREPRNYFSLLRGIAFGKTRLKEIDEAAHCLVELAPGAAEQAALGRSRRGGWGLGTSPPRPAGSRPG